LDKYFQIILTYVFLPQSEMSQSIITTTIQPEDSVPEGLTKPTTSGADGLVTMGKTSVAAISELANAAADKADQHLPGAMIRTLVCRHKPKKRYFDCVNKRWVYEAPKYVVASSMLLNPEEEEQQQPEEPAASVPKRPRSDSVEEQQEELASATKRLRSDANEEEDEEEQPEEPVSVPKRPRADVSEEEQHPEESSLSPATKRVTYSSEAKTTWDERKGPRCCDTLTTVPTTVLDEDGVLLCSHCLVQELECFRVTGARRTRDAVGSLGSTFKMGKEEPWFRTKCLATGENHVCFDKQLAVPVYFSALDEIHLNTVCYTKLKCADDCSAFHRGRSATIFNANGCKSRDASGFDAAFFGVVDADGVCKYYCSRDTNRAQVAFLKTFTAECHTDKMLYYPSEDPAVLVDADGNRHVATRTITELLGDCMEGDDCKCHSPSFDVRGPIARIMQESAAEPSASEEEQEDEQSDANEDEHSNQMEEEEEHSHQLEEEQEEHSHQQEETGATPMALEEEIPSLSDIPAPVVTPVVIGEPAPALPPAPVVQQKMSLEAVRARAIAAAQPYFGPPKTIYVPSLGVIPNPALETAATSTTAEQEHIQAEKEAARKAEQERIQAEKEAALKAEQERIQAEKEAALKAEQERIQAEKEAALKAEQERIQAEKEAALKAEQERIQAEKEAALKAEQERIQAEKEAALKAEQERIQAEKEAALKAEQERIQAEKEAAIKAEQERIQAEKEAAIKAEQERVQAEKEAAIKAEQERVQAEKEAALRADERHHLTNKEWYTKLGLSVIREVRHELNEQAKVTSAKEATRSNKEADGEEFYSSDSEGDDGETAQWIAPKSPDTRNRRYSFATANKMGHAMAIRLLEERLRTQGHADEGQYEMYAINTLGVRAKKVCLDVMAKNKPSGAQAEDEEEDSSSDESSDEEDSSSDESSDEEEDSSSDESGEEEQEEANEEQPEVEAEPVEEANEEQPEVEVAPVEEPNEEQQEVEVEPVEEANEDQPEVEVEPVEEANEEQPKVEVEPVEETNEEQQEEASPPQSRRRVKPVKLRSSSIRHRSARKSTIKKRQRHRIALHKAARHSKKASDLITTRNRQHWDFTNGVTGPFFGN
jgi:hypothetical protein